jgi:hypothetical protein
MSPRVSTTDTELSPPEPYTEMGISCYGPNRCFDVSSAEHERDRCKDKYQRMHRIAIGLGAALSFFVALSLLLLALLLF